MRDPSLTIVRLRNERRSGRPDQLVNGEALLNLTAFSAINVLFRLCEASSLDIYCMAIECVWGMGRGGTEDVQGLSPEGMCGGSCPEVDMANA